MAVYRQTRNIEASIIDFLQGHFDTDWSNINVEKTFSKVYEISLPVICVRVGITTHNPVEIGSNSTIRKPQLLIDIFAENDGQKLDLTDYVIEKIKHGCIYYNYIIVGGNVDSKVADGRIRVLSIDVTPVNLDEEKNKLDIHDRYRNLITCELSIGKVEA